MSAALSSVSVSRTGRRFLKLKKTLEKAESEGRGAIMETLAPALRELEETIWIERPSPCHGIVRSVLFQAEPGVDFGDMVLFDGAPITYHRYGDKQVPVFPHLATLHSWNHRFYDFAATQQ